MPIFAHRDAHGQPYPVSHADQCAGWRYVQGHTDRIGAFTLTVRDSVATGNAKAISTGQWVEFSYDGTAWYQSAFGSL